MAMPYRLFTRFHQRVLHGQDEGGAFDSAAKWTEENIGDKEDQFIGYTNGSGVFHVDCHSWGLIFKGYEEDGWQSDPSLKYIESFHAQVELLPPFDNDPGVTGYTMTRGVLERPAPPLKWDPALVSGKYYDGVNPWPIYPHEIIPGDPANVANYGYLITDFPCNKDIWHEAWNEYLNELLCLQHSQEILYNGYLLRLGGMTPNQGLWDINDTYQQNIRIKSVKMKFFECIVNSLSRYNFPTTGGKECKIYGLGFNNADAEMNEGSYAIVPARSWGDQAGNKLAYIYIEDRAGNIVATLDGWITGTDFTVDSNTQVTIPANKWPALPEGVYYLRMQKIFQYAPGPFYIDAYAGDFFCDPDGRIRDGKRIEIYVGNMNRNKPIYGFRGLGGAYAPIDTRAPETFYDGRVLAVSAASRQLDDESGLCQLGDLTLTLANHDRYFSDLLSTQSFKNTVVEVVWGYADEPESWTRQSGLYLVDDYDKPGPTWEVRLKDLRSEYL